MTTPTAKLPLPVNRYVRNGKYPDAANQNAIAEAVNQAQLYRGQEVLRFAAPLATLVGSSGTRVRTRTMWHSSPSAQYIWGRAVMATASKSTGGPPFTRVRVTNGAGVVIGDMDFYYGATAQVVNDTPAYFGIMSGSTIEIPADTDLFVTVTDNTDARIVSLSLYESTDPVELTENHGAMQPIYETHRANPASICSALWKHGAGPLFHWTTRSEATPRTRTSATPINIIDNSSTTVSTSSIGYTLDLRNRSTVRRGTVPCVFAVYASMAGGTGIGIVYLVDSAGLSVVELDIDSSTTTSSQWWTITCNLPATLAKYDIMVGGNGISVCAVHQVVLYQYEA